MNSNFELNFSNKETTRTQRVEQRSGTFQDNMKLPIHRWFRYSAGFSAEYASSVIGEYNNNSTDTITVLDPFSGSGTTLLACDLLGIKSYGLEMHPFVSKIAKAKLSWDVNPQTYLTEINKIIEKSYVLKKDSTPLSENKLLSKCYTPETLCILDSFKQAYIETSFSDRKLKNLIWLTITSILRKTSGAGTAQWQYVLPNKTKARVAEPVLALQAQSKIISDDLSYMQRIQKTSLSSNLMQDARASTGVPDNSIDLVITSPPYPNNYDYADATRLEMTFWGEINSWGDLHKVVRKNLVTSCSQHSAAEKMLLDTLLLDPVIEPIRDELTAVCKELETVRLTKGGKKTYHTMVAAYFIDIAKVWLSLRNLCKDGAKVCFIIGDSAPYGVYVPVDLWMGKLAKAAGFKSFEFEKIRDRNTKWKNRKHTVLLKEGRLWVNG